MVPSLAAPPCVLILEQGGRQREQRFCNIITIFYIATTSQRGGGESVCGCLCVSRGHPQSPESEEERPKQERKGVVCQTLQRVGSQSKEMSCASTLPGKA